MESVWAIYDDTCEPGYDIQTILGEKTFGKMIHKRNTLRHIYQETIKSAGCVGAILELDGIYSIPKLQKTLEKIPEEIKIVHLFSDHIIQKKDDFEIILQKCSFMKNTVRLVSENKTAGIVFVSIKKYISFLTLSYNLKNTRKSLESLETEQLKTDAFYEINQLSHFLKFMTGSFDARFFNSLKGDEYTVTKSSANKKKIKAEFLYYSFLPENMKPWFVMPYDYKEDRELASYQMERLHMTDIAVRWIHGAINLDEFESILKKLFYFLGLRKKRKVRKECYLEKVKQLYLDKVEERINQLKTYKEYEIYNAYVRLSTKYDSIEEVVKEYKELLEDLMKKTKWDWIDVIGHGDFCFSNMLYNRDTETLKLIDTKGALNEEEIWTNPYYDIAKLSHSICGRYDFFNHGMYEIKLNENMQFELEFELDHSKYKLVFQQFLEKHGYDYKLTRLYEVSLFLSMLPFHMDNPKKVFGFLLNAINELEEIKHV